MSISETTIFEWRDQGRPVDLAEDVEKLWDDQSLVNTARSIRAYADYIISQFQHEDFERDACDFLASNNGPYPELLNEISREIDGQEYNDEVGISIDSLFSYMASTEMEWIGDECVSTGNLKHVSDDKLKEFIFRYLDALAQKGSAGGWSEPKVPKLPKNFNSDFKAIVKRQVDETFASLVG